MSEEPQVFQHPNGFLCVACGEDSHLEGCPIDLLEAEVRRLRGIEYAAMLVLDDIVAETPDEGGSLGTTTFLTKYVRRLEEALGLREADGGD